MSRSTFGTLLLLNLATLLGMDVRVRAEIVTFTIDPARSSLTSDAILAALDRTPLIAQDAPDNTSLSTRYTGTLELDVIDDPLDPDLIQFVSGQVLGQPSGGWLPTLGGGSEGDPGLPSEAQFGYFLDQEPLALGYFALRDTAFSLTSDLLFVDQDEFAPFLTMTVTQGVYEYNLQTMLPDVGDTAGSDEVEGEAGDNSAASNGTYSVDGLLATLTVPIAATFGEGDDIEITFTGQLVATAFLGGGIEGDYNNNGLVEQQDLDLVLSNWGTAATPAPSNWDNDLPSGNIDQDELDSVLVNWGNQSGAALPRLTAVPEPSALILLLLSPTPLIARLRW